MKFSAVIVSLTTLGLVSAAAISDRDAKSDQQRDFDNQTKDFKNRGLCRYYTQVKTDPDYSKFTDLCEPTCGDARKIIDQGHRAAFSVSCLVGGVPSQQPYFHDPKGLEWQIGECKCDLPAVDWVVENVVAALPALGQVACAVWKEAAVESAKLLKTAASFATGAGEAKAAVQALIKLAKKLAKQGRKAGDLEAYIRKHVAEGNACKFGVADFFKDAAKVSDDFLGTVTGF